MKKPLLIVAFVYLVCVIIFPSLFMMVIDFAGIKIQSSQIDELFDYRLSVYILVFLAFVINMFTIFILKTQSFSKTIFTLIVSVFGLLAGVFLKIYIIKNSVVSDSELTFTLLWGLSGVAIVNLGYLLINKIRKPDA